MKGEFVMDEKDQEKLEKYEKQEKTQKNVAKLWVGVAAAVVLVAVIWAIATWI